MPDPQKLEKPLQTRLKAAEHNQQPTWRCGQDEAARGRKSVYVGCVCLTSTKRSSVSWTVRVRTSHDGSRETLKVVLHGQCNCWEGNGKYKGSAIAASATITPPENGEYTRSDQGATCWTFAEGPDCSFRAARQGLAHNILRVVSSYPRPRGSNGGRSTPQQSCLHQLQENCLRAGVEHGGDDGNGDHDRACFVSGRYASRGTWYTQKPRPQGENGGEDDKLEEVPLLCEVEEALFEADEEADEVEEYWVDIEGQAIGSSFAQ
jgi:hypothetical protein